MKRMAKAMILIAAITMMFSVAALAANQVYVAIYMANGVKNNSYDNEKPDDGDYKAYVTPMDANGNSQSTVFPNGGTLYARARLTSNAANVYSPLFTFTPASHKGQSKTYGAGMAKFGANYHLRTEVENCRIGNGASQWIRWCP